MPRQIGTHAKPGPAKPMASLKSSPTTFWKYLCPHEAVRFFSPLNAMNDVDDEESDEESGVEKVHIT
jgi:hypothetical protein